MSTPITGTYLSHQQMDNRIGLLRQRFILAEDGTIAMTGDKKPMKCAEHVADLNVYLHVKGHLESRGEFLRILEKAYYYDKVDEVLINMERRSEIARIFRHLDLLARQKTTEMVMANLMEFAALASQKPLIRDGYTAPDWSACYAYFSPVRMVKITASSFEYVPLGTDGVYLTCEDVCDLPAWNVLLPCINELAPRVKYAIRPEADLPMAALTSAWSLNSPLSPAHAQWFYHGRLYFQGFCSEYSLWPLLSIVGIEGSGKSTVLELWVALRTGKKPLLLSMPDKKDAWIASVTSNSLMTLDNIDGINPKDWDDSICTMSTGAAFEVRKLFTTNEMVRYELKNHGMYTTRTQIFERSDVMRRVITLDVEQPVKADDNRTKDDRIRAVLDTRTEIQAERLLHLQRILQAHQKFHAKRYEKQSLMWEYERFTYICADFDGQLEEAQDAWRIYAGMYRDTITGSNPVIWALKMWIGSDERNVGREMTGESLHAEISRICRD